MKKALGCLVIHGFAGGIYEVEPLCQHLAQQGLDCLAVQLHGTTLAEIAQTTADDWLRAALREYHKLAARYEKVAIVGFSMGGIIGAYIASRLPVERLVLVNSPIYWCNPKRMLQNIREDSATNLNIYRRRLTSATPNNGVEFLRLLAQAKRRLPQVRTPHLIVQTMDDDVIDPRSCHYLYRAMGGPGRLLMVEQGGHRVLISHHNKPVLEAIGGYLLGRPPLPEQET